MTPACFHTFHTFQTSHTGARMHVGRRAREGVHIRAHALTPTFRYGRYGTMDRDKAAAKSPGMRERMPGVAKAVDDARRDWGPAWVNEQMRRALAGEADRFFAFEGGHLLGTPFTLDAALRDDALRGAMFGARHFVAIRPPEQAAPLSDVAGFTPPMGPSGAEATTGDSTRSQTPVGGAGKSPNDGPSGA